MTKQEFEETFNKISCSELEKFKDNIKETYLSDDKLSYDQKIAIILEASMDFTQEFAKSLLESFLQFDD